MGKLNTEDKAIYEWQLDVPGFGEEGQERLRNTTALITRCGGLGGPLAFQLAAAGIGKLIIAHGGNLKHSDLNRQITMTYQGIGSPRADQIKATLNRFNPRVLVETVNSNIDEDNVKKLVSKVDIVFDCAPLFEERFLLNSEIISQNKVMIDSAMYSMEGQVMTIVPGQTACLNCLYPEIPPNWKRRFPVIGAVSALVANIAALEGIKIIAGMKGVQYNKLMLIDSMNMHMSKVTIRRNPDCKVCSHL
jgi:molybdopterin/thiamine biosynthesis adenylyltransferase